MSAVAFDHGVTGKQALQRLVYQDLKGRGLSAQPALQVIRKVADAYTTLRANVRAGNLGPEDSPRRVKAGSKPIRFRPDAAQPFDDRCLSWQHDARTVSVWSTVGRLKGVRFAGSLDHLATLVAHRKGETDLVHRDGLWLLVATCDVPRPEVVDPVGWLGVDLGIVNIATTSDGCRATGRRLNRHRRRMAGLRRKLQAKGTKSAKRVLKRVRRREARFVTDTNHTISKRHVTLAQRTCRGIGLEDLAGIRDRARLRKPQRVVLHSWAFAQYGAFVVYKAARAGVPVVFVDPRDTSRTCFRCRHVDKRNRRGQALFVCRRCGYRAHADHNASHNIGHRAGEVWNAGRQSFVPAAA